jgi:hypothetical protein
MNKILFLTAVMYGFSLLAIGGLASPNYQYCMNLTLTPSQTDYKGIYLFDFLNNGIKPYKDSIAVFNSGCYENGTQIPANILILNQTNNLLDNYYLGFKTIDNHTIYSMYFNNTSMSSNYTTLLIYADWLDYNNTNGVSPWGWGGSSTVNNGVNYNPPFSDLPSGNANRDLGTPNVNNFTVEFAVRPYADATGNIHIDTPLTSNILRYYTDTNHCNNYICAYDGTFRQLANITYGNWVVVKTIFNPVNTYYSFVRNLTDNKDYFYYAGNTIGIFAYSTITDVWEEYYNHPLYLDKLELWATTYNGEVNISLGTLQSQPSGNITPPIVPNISYPISYQICADNSTLLINNTIVVNNVTNNTFTYQNCAYGCDNISYSCAPPPYVSDTINFLIIIAVVIIGGILLKKFKRLWI